MVKIYKKISANSWELRDYEKELFFRELESFIPDKVFDAHAHIYTMSQFLKNYPEIIAKNPAELTTISGYREHMKKVIHNREISGLFLGWPKCGEGFDIDENIANNFVSAQLKVNPDCSGLMLINPGMDPEFIRQEVKRLKFSGLKCYHAYSPDKPTFSADISSYLPETQVKIAHDEGLVITLHLVKERGLADKKNQETIVRYCKKYPDMKMILAHCGRGFTPYHVLEGIGAVKKLDNIWFDSSAITEAATFEIIIREMGHVRLLYGSDFPISTLRGRSFAVGDSFVGLDEDSINRISNFITYAKIQPVMTGLESLRCHKLAAVNLKLSDNQIEDIFYNNARELFNLKA